MASPHVIYVDVLFLMDFLSDLFLLSITAMLLSAESPPWRRILAALIGGAYSLTLALPSLWPVAGFAGKVLASAVLVWVAFPQAWHRRGFWRLLGVFYAAAFALAGIVIGLNGLASGPGVGGVGPYISEPLAALALWLAARAYAKSRRARAHDRGLLKLTVEVGGTISRLTALVDTGCRLRDPVSGDPVIVADAGALAALLPEGFQSFLGEGRLPEDLRGDWATRLKVIPYTALGTESGLLLAFRPDRVMVTRPSGQLVTGRAVVALSPRRLSSAGDYHAIMPPEVCGMNLKGGAA